MTTATKTRTPIEYVTTVGFGADLGGRGFHLPVHLAVRSDGRVYVLSRSAPITSPRGLRIGVCNVKHEWFGEFGGHGGGDGQFIWPTALTFDPADNLYVADESQNRITVFDAGGKFKSKWGKKGSAPGEIDGPSGLVFNDRGELLVVDHKNHRIQKFTPGGEFISGWGEFGSGKGQFNYPWSIAPDSAGNVYVADWRNDRIQRFSDGGKFLDAYGATGRGEGQFVRPSDVAVDADGFIYVADWGNQRVQVFDSGWKFIASLRGQATLSPWAQEYLEANADELDARSRFQGSIEVDTDDPHEQSARIEPYFWGPVAVEFDRQGQLLVLETNRHRFQVYRRAQAAGGSR